MGCGEEWLEVGERIAGLYGWAVRLASRAALAGRPRLFVAATRAGEELLLLRHDLEAWEPGECFDPVEFGVRLRRIEGVLRGVEAELSSPRLTGGGSSWSARRSRTL